jgi:hypothetical protein
MNQSDSLISNKYIVDEGIIHEYIQKKNELMKERKNKANLNVLFTIIITLLYYLDIITDLFLSWRYYINGDIWWFGYTIGIVVFSNSFNTWVL